MSGIISDNKGRSSGLIKGAAGVSRTTVSGCWCDWNGTGTIAIRDSYNVSSLTDNATGTYTVNFDADCGDTNYAPLLRCDYPGGTNNHHLGLGNAAGGYGTAAKAADSCKTYVNYNGGSPQDTEDNAASFYGDWS